MDRYIITNNKRRLINGGVVAARAMVNACPRQMPVVQPAFVFKWRGWCVRAVRGCHVTEGSSSAQCIPE